MNKHTHSGFFKYNYFPDLSAENVHYFLGPLEEFVVHDKTTILGTFVK